VPWIVPQKYFVQSAFKRKLPRKPVCGRKTRQIGELAPRFDCIEAGKAPVIIGPQCSWNDPAWVWRMVVIG